MTKVKDLYGTAEAVPFQNKLKLRFFGNLRKPCPFKSHYVARSIVEANLGWPISAAMSRSPYSVSISRCKRECRRSL
jgi:hypothetical protein